MLIGEVNGLRIFLAPVYRYRERQDLLYYAVQLFGGTEVAGKEN